MKRCIILALVLFVGGTAAFAEGKPGVHKNDFGMVFQIQGLSALVQNDNDGIIPGVGLRFWILPELVLRAVLFFDVMYTTATDTTAVNAGVSLGAEYHFVKGPVSPYAGILVGLEATNMPAPGGIDWHGGVLAGVELTPFEFLSFFVEYSLLVTFRQVGTEVDLGYNHQPIFGFIIYFI